MVELGKSPKKGEAKIFTDEQIRKMYNVLYYNQANEEAIFTIKTVLMLIYNGCRISEFLSLKTADVNLSEQYFEIKEAKTEAGIRKVPIHKCMLRYYQDFYDSNNEYLLTNPKTKKKYSYANYRDSYFDRLKIELEWDEDITPHNARKTCASLLKKYGVDATYQKLIIGHEGALDLTERTYTYIDVEQLVEAINQIPSVDTL
jgi:integrase